MRIPRPPIIGEIGQDQNVPELSADTPYDPFKVDVFTVGNLFQTELLSVSPFRRLSTLFSRLSAKYLCPSKKFEDAASYLPNAPSLGGVSSTTRLEVV